MATNLHQVKRGYADLKRSGTQMYYERMGHGDDRRVYLSIPLSFFRIGRGSLNVIVWTRIGMERGADTHWSL